jgi:hypothetical protein
LLWILLLLLLMYIIYKLIKEHNRYLNKTQKKIVLKPKEKTNWWLTKIKPSMLKVKKPKIKLKNKSGIRSISKIKRNISLFFVSIWSKRREKRDLRKKEKINKKIKKAHRKSLKVIIKKKKREERKKKRSIKKQVRGIHKKIRRKEVEKREIGYLRKILREWKEQGYYDTTKLQKKLDKLEGKKPWK